MKKFTQQLKWISLAFMMNLGFSINAYPQYSGTHYVGSGEEFATIQEAIDSLVSQGITGATSIIIKTGNYHEQLNIPPIPGASSTNTILLQSETKNPEDVLIYYDAANSSSNYVIYLNDCDYVSFEYLKILNSTLNTSYSCVIGINSTAEYNKIKYCKLIGESGSPTAYSESIIYFYRKIAPYFEVSYNEFQGGSYALCFDTYADTEFSQGLKINHNTINSNLGLFLERQDKVEIIGNEINSNGSGIQLTKCREDIKILYNTINCYSTSGHTGIYLNDSDGSIAFPGLTANNLIIVRGQNDDDNNGIYLTATDYQNFYHNTIDVQASSDGGCAFYANSGSNIKVKNNIFTTLYGYAHGSSNGTNIVESDYNNYYTEGNYIAYWNGGGVNSLADLRTANSKDGNSTDFYPSFKSLTDLHPTTHWLNGTGTNLSAIVEYDYDSIPRPTTPDIGAYEFTPNNTTTYSGNLTIKATGGDFHSFTEAIDSLEKLGVSGPVTLLADPGTYNEQILIRAIPGVNETNTLTITSSTADSTAVVVQFNSTSASDNYVLCLQNTDYVTVEKITLKNTGGSYATALLLVGNASHNTIQNNILQGNGTASSSANRAVIYSVDYDPEYLLIQSNVINSGSMGIYIDGISTTIRSDYITIKNNKIDGGYYGIYLQQYTNFELSANSITNFTYEGISCEYCSSPFHIKSNILSSTSYTERGINLYRCTGSGDGGLTYNNFIYLSNTQDIRGIYIYDSFFQSIYNNSINIVSSNTLSKALEYDGYSGSGSNMVFKNNNLAVDGPGYPLYVENGGATVAESDYNNLFTAGTYVANWSTVNYSDVTSLSSASGKDTHSVNYAPGYISSTDLHSNSYWIDGKGIPISSIVTVDIDGEARNGTTPDIGADEFTSTLVPYAGEYTIGPTGRFATFNIAIDSLIERGVLDSVTLKVQSGIYPEQMVIPQIANISVEAAIIFESETGNSADVIVSYDPTSANNYVVKFEGADYITFKNISFQSGSSTYSHIFYFTGKCENLTFNNNFFQGRSESSTTDYDAVFYAKDASPILKSLTIQNNTFSNGSFGIYFENSSGEYGENLDITENTFSNFQQGIYLNYFVAPIIEKNNITILNTDGIGINAQHCSSAASYGMRIRKNQIFSNSYTNTYGAMYLRYCDANPTFPGLISNNVIQVGTNSASRSIGMNIIDSDYLNIYHNSVNIRSNQSNDYAFYSTLSNNINIVNNNFAIKGSILDKSSGYGYAMYILDGTIGTADYNNLYSPGKHLAYWEGSAYGTLVELQAATSKNTHSINYLPAFRNADNLKTNSYWLDGKGTPISTVTTDIDGVTRNTLTPDIGAYEYTSTLSPISGGPFTVGLGGNYPTLDSLANALMECGISSPLTVNLLQGTFNNTNFFLKDIPGVSASDTIVIQSQSSDASNTILACIQEVGSNYITRLNGTDYLTFKNLKFNAGGTTYTNILTIEGNSQHVNILDCVFNGISATSDDYTNKSCIYVPTSQIVDNLLIKGNTFSNNSYGIYLGGFQSFNHQNITITENTLNGQYRQIYAYRTMKPSISKNVLNAGLESGIYLNECDNDFMVTANKIFSSEIGYIGIYCYYCDGTVANKGLIANNFTGVNGTSAYNSYGIKLDNSNYQLVYNNSSMISGNGIGSALDIYGGGNIQVVNNIFSSSGSDTYTFKTNNTTAVSTCDYNNFYTTSTKNIQYNQVDYPTLSAYQAASFMDVNSLDVNPVFTSSTDFHLLADSVVGKAVVLTEITTDFDGETRDTSHPDIGADEFSCAFFPTPIVEDAKACSNEDIPTLYAEGTNIKWYSDNQLTNELWAANDYKPSVTEVGTYKYYVTQSLGECTSTPDSVTLKIIASPELSAQITHIDCQGTNYGSINLTVSGTAGPFSYLWSNEKITEDITGLTAGQYIAHVMAANGCSETDTFTVTAPSELLLDITTLDTECDTSFGKATVVVTGGEAPYNYQWTNGETGTVIDSLYAGIYYVTVTDNRGCSKFGIATINDIGAPSITVSSVTDVSCYGGNDGAISLAVSGDDTPYQYLWSNGETTEDINTLGAGQYELEVKDSKGCKSIKSIGVTEPQPVKISMNITETSCGMNNGAAEAIISGGVSPYTYNWSTGSTSTSIENLGLGSYNLNLTDNHACSSTKYFTISEIGAPTVLVDSIYEGTCGDSNGAIYISAYGAYSTYNYLWSNGDDTEDLIGVNPGTYSVTVSDSSGCSAMQVATINADKPPINPICMVTVDTESNHNIIVWEKEYSAGVKYYNVYKEGSQSGKYSVVGTVNVNELSEFTDTLSDVMQRSWRYKLSVVDSCDVESDLSPNHKTMHLTINLGINNTINLIWDHYEGFDFETYYIHRRSDAGWELLDSVPNNLTSYTDESPVLDQYLYYMIEIKHPSGCDPTKASRTSSRSNVSNPTKASSSSGILIIDNSLLNFSLYPNPNSGTFNVKIETTKIQEFRYSVYDITGRLTDDRYLGKVNGSFEKEIKITKGNGMYFVKIYGSSGEFTKRVIVNK